MDRERRERTNNPGFPSRYPQPRAIAGRDDAGISEGMDPRIPESELLNAHFGRTQSGASRK